MDYFPSFQGLVAGQGEPAPVAKTVIEGDRERVAGEHVAVQADLKNEVSKRALNEESRRKSGPPIPGIDAGDVGAGRERGGTSKEVGL